MTKNDEITKTPEFLDQVNVEKPIVTVDMMDAQTEIAEKIANKKRIIALLLREPNPISMMTSLYSGIMAYQVCRMCYSSPSKYYGS